MSNSPKSCFYIDKRGQRVGPVTGVALKALAQQGVITQDTIIENAAGKQASAGTIPGLFADSAVVPPPVSTPTPAPAVNTNSSHLTGVTGGIKNVASVSKTVGGVKSGDSESSQPSPDSRYEYKSVAILNTLSAQSTNWKGYAGKSDEKDASYVVSDTINQHCFDGWEFMSFVGTFTVSHVVKHGCIIQILKMIPLIGQIVNSWFDDGEVKSQYNVFVFRKSR